MTDTTTNTIADWLTREAERRRQIAELRPINKRALFDAFAAAGVTRVVVSFDGSCDSGQIESVDAYTGEDSVELPSGDVEFATPAEDGSGPRYAPRSVRDAIETLAYDALEEEHGGWENNDGAFGEFTFDVAERSITLGYNERFSDSTYYEYTY